MREYTELERIRLEKLERLRANGIEPYPARVKRTHTAAEAIAQYSSVPALSGEAAHGSGPEIAATVCGRLRAVRTMGKATFAHIEDGTGRIQIYMRADEIGTDMLKTFGRDFDLGDFIQASGVLFRTKTGEITLRVRELTMLAKAVTPLPAAKEEIVDGQRVIHYAFSDTEQRYRQRYVDLAVNPEVRDEFRTRARIISAFRRFLDDRDFLEVETPILQPLYGGAAARPFTTHHRQLHQDLYLRISFELYLKRLLVGGYERVYEIGRDFRNEGVSFKHNPEFTMLEFYWAYADYNDVMNLTEQMVTYVADNVLGRRTITYDGHRIDLTPPWPRMTVREAIREHSGIDYADHPTGESLAAAMRAIGHNPETTIWGKLLDSLLGTNVEPKLIQPTFLMDYPRDISPLAKAKPGDPNTVERFEGFIGGMEVCNAFSELNDPLDQEQRFLEMGRAYDANDEEAHPMDEDYLRAMRYGMPPNGGFGLGIDRFTMLLTDKATIREVVLYPHLRKAEGEA
ncbi:MAG: lysine--tRNA ligase [Chloroflexi bacterium]|nr:lysine--tRNA ligase [Chloroflexota bacterium]